ncbi:Replicative DNA helicase [Elusimicrobium minutum Pei191]|uniref:Replicative DNA helicase n=1 Tax=Elusimicrobium minutum (strain Pei191) TaxID=445932 RepID=B2KBY0_ELUMP|nr:replicative DNA helicase [Elusimicrobium minutum]ACC97884.1 Replicative DNA helicase [Elusimicrobium minutum Pei191]
MADNILDKVPPQAIDAEMAVLGSMLIEAQAVERAFDILKAEHFYKDAHKKIFSAMRNLADKNQAIDTITLTEELKTTNQLAVVGGEVYLAELIDKVSTAAHVEHYAEIVYKKFLVRDLIKISTTIIQESYKQEDEPEKLIDLAQEQIFKISQKQDIKGFIAAKDLAEEVMHLIEKARLDKNPVKGVPTGFTEFDYKTGGFRKSDLIIIGARPSQGKTALALNVAHFASVVKNIPIAFFSLEMGKNSIFERMLCSAAMADVHQVRSGIFKMEKWRDLTREAGRLAQAPFFIDDTPGITITEIRMRARRLANDLEKQGKQLGMIMIDYLQLIRSTGRFESRQQEVSEISRMLKELARTLDVPVVALSQLSRKNEDRSRVDNKPQLSDLRESGSIEQDADVVALIHRDGYYKRDDESLKRKATLIIAKQRNGPVGDVDLNFISEHTLFTNPAPENIEVGEYGDVSVPM